MQVDLYRFTDEVDYTYGLLFIDGEVQAFTLEDEKRLKKVSGETRIPAGRYEIKFREVLSGLTKTYRDRFPDFTWHLWLQDVPGFNYVYIHIGNTDDDTEACVLVANTCDLTPPTSSGFIGESTDCFKKIYKIIGTTLRLNKESVHINIYDNEF
jgi:hypothetical protein